MLLPQVNQAGLHIFRPHGASYLHCTFRRSVCPFAAAKKKAMILGNQLVALLQLFESLTTGNGQSGAVGLAMNAPRSPLHNKRRQTKLT